MEDFVDVPHIHSPLLYVFQADLMRIGRFIKDVLQNINVYTGYGKLYGLYTHSRAAVVHVTTLQNLTQRELQHTMSNRIKVKENEYSLSLVGEWFTVQNSTISVRELLRKKADTLNGSETYFCFVVEKVQMKSRFVDISKFIKAFLLAKGKIYKVDMKIINRESPFRFDVDFNEKISLGEYVDEKRYADESKEFVSNGNEYLGTELKEMSGVSTVKTEELNCDNSLNRNENKLPVLENESVSEHVLENETSAKVDSSLITGEPSIDSNCIEVKENAKEFGTAGQKKAEYSTSDNDLWVDIKPSDVSNVESHSRTTEVRIQDVSRDGKQEETTIEGSKAEKDSTIENKFISDHTVQPSDKNDEKESGNIKAEDSQVASEEILSSEEDSVNRILSDVERKTVATKDGVDTEEQEINQAEHFSLTEIKGNTTKNDGELRTVYTGEEKTDTGGSIHEENLTKSDDENGKNIMHSGPRQSENNEIGESGQKEIDIGGSIHEESSTKSDDESGKNIVHSEPRQSENIEVGESGQDETDIGSSIHEESLTKSDEENEKNIVHSGPRQSEKNEIGESEGTIAKDSEVANRENEEKLTNVVSVDEEGKITENDGKSIAEEREERKSTVEVAGKDKIEDSDDVGRNEEKLQHIENSERQEKISTEFDEVTAENEPKIGGGKSQEIQNGENNEFNMETLENSLSAEESSDDYNKINNEEQKNTFPKDENLPQEETVDDTSVGNKNEYIVEQSKQNHSGDNYHEISSVPSQENHFTHNDHESEN